MYQKIMVPLDGSELAECVFPHVEAFIKDSFVKTAVFVRVVEPLPVVLYGEPVEAFPAAVHGESLTARLDDLKKVEENMVSSAQEYLEKKTETLKNYGAEIQCVVLVGNVAETLITYGEKNNVDMTIIATHGRSGVSRWLMGSVADRILHSSHMAVLMVRAPENAPAK